MTFARYAVGSAALFTSIALVGRGANAAAGRLMPDASRALHGLVVIVLTVATFTVVSEVLGTVRLFHFVPLTIVLSFAGLSSARFVSMRPTPTNHTLPIGAPTVASEGRIGRVTNQLTISGVVVVAAGWLVATVRSFESGITAVDAIWYHLPTAARFAQSGSTWDLHVLDTSSLTIFYPAGSELIHAVGAAFLGTDALSPALNLGWLVVGLLAGWCIGSRYGIAPFTLLATAMLFGTPQLVRLNAGQALNDIAVTSLVLAALAIVVHAADPRGARWLSGSTTLVAGITAGLAIGMKWTVLAPVAALTISIPFLVRRGDRARTSLVWLAATAGCGGYWYLRNLVAVGAPIPPLKIGVGPIHLTQIRPGIPTFSVVRYLSNSEVWRRQLLPGLRLDFGPAWWSVLVLAGAGLLCGFVVSRDRTVWVLASVGFANVLVYLLAEQGFNINLWKGTPRYAAPGVALGLIVLIIVSARSNQARMLVLVILGGTLAATQFDSQLWRGWWQAGGIKTVVATLGATAVVAAAVALLAFTPRITLLGQGWPIAALILLSLGSAATLARYRGSATDHGSPQEAAARALRARHVVDSRIALTGSLFVSGSQYGYYDKRLTNFVQYVGEHSAHRVVRPFSDCHRFMHSIAAGRYDYVVAEATASANGPIHWLASAPSARQLFRDARGRVSVFELIRAPKALECP